MHVGPYKTGSTALQGALHRARDELARHDAAYAGQGSRAMRAGWAVLGETPRGRHTAVDAEWSALVDDVRHKADARLCLSSEDLAMAGPDVVRRIVTDLGADRVHVLVVARRLDRLLPSQWQQRTQEFGTLTYDAFLHAVLDEDVPDDDPTRRTFWRSHDLADLVGRWVAEVGGDRVTVVVADEDDRTLLPSTVERLLALPPGLLEVHGSNPSLTAAGVELFRRLNGVAEQRAWPDAVFARIAKAMVGEMQQVPRHPDDDTVRGLPAWAVDRVRHLSRERATALLASGAVLVGDPSLVEACDPARAAAAEPEVLRPDVVVAALTGVVSGHRRELRRIRAGQDPAPEPSPRASTTEETLLPDAAARRHEAAQRLSAVFTQRSWPDGLFTRLVERGLLKDVPGTVSAPAPTGDLAMTVEEAVAAVSAMTEASLRTLRKRSKGT